MRKSVLILFSLLIFSNARAQTEASEKIRIQFEELRKKLTEGEEEQREVMSSLFEINKKMKYVVSERAKTEQQRMTMESSTKTLAGRILELEQKIKEQKTLLQVRLNAIYKLGGQGLARLIFSSTSSAQLERNLKILGLVAKNDLAMMKDYSKSVAELAQKRQKFLARLDSLKKAQKKVSQQEKWISNESIAKAKILDSIRRGKTKTLAKLRSLREKGQRIGLQQDDELLDLLLKPSFFEKKGALPSPVAGVVTRRFGPWKDATYNVTLNHKGLFYQTRAETPVVAVFPGKVAFAGDIEGFGPSLILDHGDHYYSVYSGVSQMLAKEGLEISEGQKIASANDGLYFEIRHFSEPYDPLQWMKGQQP